MRWRLRRCVFSSFSIALIAHPRILPLTSLPLTRNSPALTSFPLTLHQPSCSSHPLQLLSRLDTITCAQITTLIADASKPQGSISGQEERDLLFARLFGFTAVIQSGLLVRTKPLPSASSSTSASTTTTSTSTSTPTSPSSLASYQTVLTGLFALGDAKAWLRESAWWTLGLALDALHASSVPWKDAARDWTAEQIYKEREDWSPEKVAITLKMQKLYPELGWKGLLAPAFRNKDLLSNANLPVIAKIIKDTRDEEDEDEVPKAQAGNWKPQLHFVWDIMLAELLPAEGTQSSTSGSFQEFFHHVVDGTYCLPTLDFPVRDRSMLTDCRRLAILRHRLPAPQVLGLSGLPEGPSKGGREHHADAVHAQPHAFVDQSPLAQGSVFA